MKHQLNRKPTTMMIDIKRKDVLKASWMPFISGGALFIPTKSKFNLGDPLLLIASIPGDPSKYTTEAKVSWLSPQHQAIGSPLGVGIQLLGPEGLALKVKIEGLVGGVGKSSGGETFSI